MLRSGAARFFALDGKAKLGHACPDFHYGFRPCGRQHSATPDRPDPNESFAYWSDDPKLIPEHEAIGPLLSAMNQCRVALARFSGSVLSGVAARFSSDRTTGPEGATRLEANSYSSVKRIATSCRTAARTGPHRNHVVERARPRGRARRADVDLRSHARTNAVRFGRPEAPLQTEATSDDPGADTTSILLDRRRHHVALLAQDSILRDASFRSYYAGQSVALFCAAVTPITMPLIAVLSLHASGFEASVVSAISLVPAVLLTLPVGAIVDRLPKREAMLWANLAQAVSLGLLPLLWWLHALSILVLCLVGLTSTSFAIVSQVADQSLIPFLVEDSHLIEANSRMALSESVATMAGPTAAGFLMTALGGPPTVGLAAFGSVFSAVTLFRIRSTEPSIVVAGERTRLRQQILEGLRFVVRNPVLRTLMAINGVDNGFLAWIQAILMVFYVRVLDWSAQTVGLVLGVAAVGGIIGSMLAGRLHKWLGTDRLLLTAVLAGGPAEAVVLLLHPGFAGKLIAVAAQFIAIFFSVCYSVTSRSLRQIASPDGLRSRVIAAHRWVSVAVMPVGALAGGFASTRVGLRGSIALACLGLLAAPIIALTSPLRHVGNNGVAGAFTVR
ncbi:MFS transporter [Kitasatospora sp. NBC_01287]|uniref:MFS transporter n=1 Tax=Kitasatospora sp. NBC_01287 TaxID=2903573 RepID=UPI002250C0ED|nr:MFS transporter [Kitasatospora sp. NBC_01287]MCX4744982.1 MFS transporter [Kitasatospora sp. NBC_01287]